MNRFVDFGKRSINLPEGCKDLIDVLGAAKRQPVQGTESVVGIANLAKFLPGIVESAAKSKSILITWRESVYVHLMNEQGVISAVIIISESTGREQAVREIFTEAGLSPAYDEAPTSTSICALRYPLPSDYSKIEKLVFDLLRRGFGLSEDVTVQIMFWEDEV